MSVPRLVLSGLAGLALAASTIEASAAERRWTFDLKVAPLGQALLAFNAVSGAQVIVSRDLLAGRTARPVRGRHTAPEALALLLAGTGLHAEVTARGVLMIRPDGPPPPSAKATSPTRPTLAPPPAEEAARMEAVMVVAVRPPPVTGLSTLDGARLDQLGIVGMDQVGRLTPGLSAVSVSPATAGFSMRGVTQASGDASREPRMAMLQDGMPASKERGAYFELFDLERVDVAKGPQPTLYGRGAMAGAVDVIQRKADPSGRDWSTRVEIGDKGHRTLDLMANQPLGETLALRLAARSRRRDGLIANLSGGPALNSVATDAARLSLGWRPGDGDRLDLIVNYQRDRPGGRALKSLIFLPTDPTTGAVLADLGRATAASLSANDEQGRSAPLGLDRTLVSAALISSHRLGDGLTLDSTLGYRRFYADERQDGDGLALPVLGVLEQTRGSQASADLRLGYEAGGRWRAFAGVAFFHEDGTQRASFTLDERLMLARLVGGLTPPAPPGLAAATAPDFIAAQLRQLAARRGVALAGDLALRLADNLKAAYVERNQNFGRTTAVDVYGDVTFAPTPAWALSVGLRYSRDAKDSAVATSLPRGPSVLAGVGKALAMDSAARTSMLNALASPGAGASADTPRSWPNYAIVFQPTAGNGQRFASTLSGGGWSGRVTARYAPAPGISAYAAYARGRRPSVLVAGPPLTAEGAARFGVVPAETIDSVEVGSHVLAADQRLSLDLAAYGYRYVNFQTTKLVDGELQTLNAGRADAVGLEAQARYEISPAVHLIAAYGFNHSRLRSGAFAGNRFRLAPDHKVSISAELARPVPGGQFTVLPAWSWQSKIFFSDDNDRPDLSRGLVRDVVQDEVQRAYGLLDLRLEYRPSAGRWSAGVFVTNLLNNRYIADAGFIGESFGFSASAAGPARLWGVSVNLRR
ncbi:MAG: TonB-dependent receptor [Pseudomonadota bacterium]|jgi:iron complex outermembrane receptor protein